MIGLAIANLLMAAVNFYLFFVVAHTTWYSFVAGVFGVFVGGWIIGSVLTARKLV